MPTTATQKGMLGFVVLLAGFFIVMGPVALLTAGDETWEPNTFERVLLGGVPIVSGLMILTGLYVFDRSPRLGAGLLSGGTIIMACLWFWLFFIGIPVAILVTWYSFARAKQMRRDHVASNNRFPPGAAA